MSNERAGTGAAVTRNEITESLLEKTRDLVAIPSVSGGEKTIADWTQNWFSGHAGETTRIGNNVVHRSPQSADRPLVVLAGHLDTVPPQNNERCNLKDGRLEGLGTTDMKSGLAIMLELSQRIPSASCRFDLAWIFYECEEVAFERNGMGPVLDHCDWLGAAQLAFLLEPTDCKVELGCLGTLHAEFTVHGKAAHSARPWTGENAIYRSIPFLKEIADRQPQPIETGGVTYKETVEITRAEAGGGRNVIPGEFTLNLNYRYAPTRSPNEAIEIVRGWAREGITVEVIDVAPPAPPRSEHPLVAEFIRDHGHGVRAKQAWTDVARFAALDVPAINFGPGIPELAHRAEEYVPVENLIRGYQSLEGFLLGPEPSHE